MSAALGPKRHRPTDSPFRLALNPVLTSLFVALLLVASSAAQGAVINAASPSLPDVRRAIASAADGDTVMVPAGTASWTSSVRITKGITISGQTTTNSDNGTANDQTILVDNIVDAPGGQGFFHCTTNAGQSLRITGLTFTGVEGSRPTMMFNGAIRISGTSTQVRIDHCHFISLNHQPTIGVFQTIRGVSDHLVFTTPRSQCQGWKFFNGTGFGDLEFAQPAGYGSSDFFFIEDCWIDNSTGGDFSGNGGVDGAIGCKFVVRHCHLFNVEILAHGTELSRDRGGRAQEIYNNDYHWNYTTTLDGIRTGSLIAHDNTFVGNPPRGFGLQTYRLFYRWAGSPWLGSSGDNPFDMNVAKADGTYVEGHSPYLFDSGTVTSGSENTPSGAMTLMDTSKNWTTNQWVNYTAKRVSDSFIGQIISNNNNTLTMRFYSPNGSPYVTWRSGDSYQIHKVLVSLDQAGRGRGDLITGNRPINSETGTVTWPHQELEPCYSWNNIHSPSGKHINFIPSASSAAILLAGRDFYDDTPMPGYTPYTYPHPLVTGQPLPTASATHDSQRYLNKSGERKAKKVKTWKWGRAKESSANKTAERIAPGQ